MSDKQHNTIKKIVSAENGQMEKTVAKENAAALAAGAVREPEKRGYSTQAFSKDAYPVVIRRNHAAAMLETFPSMHDSFELMYVISGELNMMINEVSYIVKPGGFALINYEDIHRLSPPHASVDYDCILLQYDFCNEIGLDIAVNRTRTVVYDETVKAYYKAILHEDDKKEEGYQNAIKCYALLLLTHLFRYYKQESGQLRENHHYALHKKLFSPQTMIAREALGYIRKHYTENLNAREISEQIGVSLPHLCRCFMNTTGMSMTHYINYLRCINARACILSGKYTVKAAAYACGYQNMSYFSRTYKRIMGILPSETK